MKPVNVKSNTYINSGKKINNKFIIGDIVRISKIKIFLQKVTFQVGLKKLKILFLGHMLSLILHVKKLLGCFTYKNFKNLNQKVFRVEKVTKRKGDKLHVKWKGYNNSFNS